jgi:hypothetical protein
MPKKHLLIVKRSPPPMIGVCEACNQQFKSSNRDFTHAEFEVRSNFNTHECKALDSSQNALRVVREATEGK